MSGDQVELPWNTVKVIGCPKCLGAKEVHYLDRPGVIVIGGKRIPCPACNAKGTIREIS